MRNINKNKICIDDVFENNKNDSFKIIEILENNIFKIKFLDKYGYETCVNKSNLIKKVVKNKFFPNVFNIGFIGDGIYNPTHHKTIYDSWIGMFRRCYDIEYHETHPTYKNSNVCCEWHNFQNFAKWYDENFPYKIHGIKFQLDKDLLQQGVENKIYSPDTCCFLPYNVNAFISTKMGINHKNNYVGVNWHTRDNVYYVRCRDFLNNKVLSLGYYKDKEEAIKVYKKNKNKQINNVINYLCNLNYLSNEIIYLLESIKLGED